MPGADFLETDTHNIQTSFTLSLDFIYQPPAHSTLSKVRIESSKPGDVLHGYGI